MSRVQMLQNLGESQITERCEAWLKQLVIQHLTPGRGMLLRGFTHLPVMSGFDLDVLIPADQADALLAGARELASRDDNLTLLVRRRVSGCKLILMDLTPGPGRRWLLLDIQYQLRIGRHTLRPEDIAVCEKSVDGFVFMAPEASWQHFLRFVQDVRKGRALGAASEISVFLRDNPELCAATEISADMTLSEMAVRLGLVPYARGPAAPTSKQVLSRLVFIRLFFWHHHRPWFVCVSGPDGVGKSTLLDNMMRIMDGLPLAVNHFHHTELAKSKLQGMARTLGKSANAGYKTDRGATHHNFAWRLAKALAPHTLRRAAQIAIGEYRYMAALNAELAEDYFSGRISLLDRYSQDRWLKMQVHDKSRLQRLMAKISVRILRPPRLLIVPIDEAQAIHTRKPELTVQEVSWYYSEIAKFAEQRKIPVLRLPVLPDRVAMARRAVNGLFEALGDEVFDAISKFENSTLP